MNIKWTINKVVSLIIVAAKKNPTLQDLGVNQATGKKNYLGYTMQADCYADWLLRKRRKIFRHDTLVDEAFGVIYSDFIFLLRKILLLCCCRR